jgi:hypothetical protein
MRAAAALTLALACAAAFAACGGDDARRSEPRVALRLATPADAAVVRDDTVEIGGRVAPAGSAVTVLGRAASVAGDTFSARVRLHPGANIIDVAATAPGRRAAFAALRVTREVRVRVPDLAGRDAAAAEAQLTDLGLEVDEQRGGGLFDPLLPGDPKVCESRPGPGAELLPGTTVQLVVARACG